MRRGRPLRFLALVLGGWVAARIAMVWPAGEAPREFAGIGRHAPASRGELPWQAAPAARTAAARLAIDRIDGGSSSAARAPRVHRPSMLHSVRRYADLLLDGATKTVAAAPPGDIAATSLPDDADSPGVPRSPTELEPRAMSRPAAQVSAHLHGDTYLVVRPTGGDSLAFGQLGASQAGMRVTYALDPARRLELSARVSAPLRGVGREAAVGGDLRPTRLPIHLLIEGRLPLDGGSARPAAQLIGGFAKHLAFGLTAESYAQAGGVYRRGGFADGAARLTRPLAASRLFSLDLGAGVWGAAQRGVARLDLGPTLGLTLPARGGSVRLAIDYRRRAAGRARPGSGPALSLGSSF